MGLMRKKKITSEQAETLLKEYAYCKRQKKEADETMKQIAEKLLLYADQHQEDFNGLTLTLENGKLVWVNGTEIKVKQEFDIEEFGRAYPKAVKKSLSVSEVKKVLDVQPSAASVHGIEMVDKDPVFTIKV